MAEGNGPVLGSIGWMDLTVGNAEEVRAFYEKVAGWKAQGVDMGGYSDYTMTPQGGDAPVAGVCHARGANASQPAVWMVYITVANLDDALREVEACGGKVLLPARKVGETARYAVMADPAGAVASLYQA